MLIDTHCHLYDPVFNDRISEVQQLALQRGVQEVLLPNVDVHSIDLMDQVRQSYPELTVRKMVGLHPCYVKEDWRDQLQSLKEYYLAAPYDYCAVGEIGLDLYWDKSTQDIQVEALREQLAWSVEWNLPVALHVRSAFKELFPVLEEEQRRHDGQIKGVFHCFSGGKKQINRALRLGGFYFGLGGVITYNRSATDPVVAAIPDELIVLETDAPYLTPAGEKGKKNEPGFMDEVAAVVAEIKGWTLDECHLKTAENTRALFG